MKQFLPLMMTALLAATTARAAEFSAAFKSSKGEMVSDVVVSLVPLDPAGTMPRPASTPRIEIAQEGQEYTTYVTAVQAGSKVYFPNRDTVQHHVYSLSKPKKFELPLYNPGSAESETFDLPGVVTLGCNIHDWMLAYVVVVPTPYFAKSDGAGTATVTAPPGRYRLEVWHPRLAATLTEEITLADGIPTRRDLALTLKADRRIRRGPEGRHSGY